VIAEQARRELPTGTVTFLFTDIDGSTRLLAELGPEQYGEALAEHRALLRAAFAQHGGVEVDTQGDAFFIAFPDAALAAKAAAAAQEALSEGRIRVRMGLHTGQPHLTSEGYVGHVVHLAARICAAGHGGQVLVSKASAEALREGQELTDLGEHRLKDFAQPVWIYQLGSRSFPPLKTISNTNLPRPASSFIGREREVDEVTALLRNGARLLNLTGPGGTGKTRLSIEAATELIPDFKAGVFWVPLASLRDHALVSETVAHTIGAKDELADHIAEREMLLLIDNLEQVVAAAPQLATLVESCPNLRVLTTSREVLRVRGEVEYPVPPLAEREAVELFSTRSGLSADDTVESLCRRLENLPLAVELAAARARVLTPQQILDRLSGRLDLLKGGRDADPRQQTLRAAIEWSHELLDDGEKVLFARLAVFRGGCTLDAAEIVVDADLDTLQSLVDKSLVRHSGDRFWMLETIREFAAERLDASGEANTIRRRHAGFFLALAEEADPHLRDVALRGGVREVHWLARIDSEHDNLRAALDVLSAASDTQLVLRLTGALVEYWFERTNFVELRQRLTTALAADASPTSARAKALIGMSDALSAGGDEQGAQAAAKDALAIYRSIGDRSGVADAVWRLGSGTDVRESIPQLLEAFALFQEVDDQQSALNVSRSLAWAYQQLGDRARANKLYRETLARARLLDNPYIVHVCLGALAMNAAENGRTEEARALAREHIPMPDDFGRLDLSTSLERAAFVLVHAGEWTSAVSLLAAAEHISREIQASQAWVAQFHERTRAMAAEHLHDADFAEAWERGSLMTDDEACSFARDALGGAREDATAQTAATPHD
jgi:predicted ATPase/class 3 adenylate cyclase